MTGMPWGQDVTGLMITVIVLILLAPSAVGHAGMGSPLFTTFFGVQGVEGNWDEAGSAHWQVGRLDSVGGRGGGDSFSGSWIWEEYEGAPGPLYGDDVLHWGPGLGPYHNYTEVMFHLDCLEEEFPEWVSVEVVGTSYLGLAIPCMRVAAPGNHTGRGGLLVVAHHHGREAITVENALYLVDYLVANRGDPEVSSILETFVVYVIPTLNPDALGVLHVNPWQRKNLRPVDEDDDGLGDEWEVGDVDGDFRVERYWDTDEYEGEDLDGDGMTGEDLPGGVDLNRNYPVAFEWGDDDPRSQIYRGAGAFSEPETQAMRNFTLHHGEELVFGLSLHSGIEALLTPWGFSWDITPHDPLFTGVAQAVEEETGYPFLSSFQLYPVYGCWEDWMYGELGVPAVTLETYGNSSALPHSVWDLFNPCGNQVIDVCMRVWRAFVAMAGVLMDEPGEPSISAPPLVPGLLPTPVAIHVEGSRSGTERVWVSYTFDGSLWGEVEAAPLKEGLYHALLPTPILGGLVTVQVWVRDFAGHEVSSELFTYQVWPVTITLIASVLCIQALVILRSRREGDEWTQLDRN